MKRRYTYHSFWETVFSQCAVPLTQKMFLKYPPPQYPNPTHIYNKIESTQVIQSAFYLVFLVPGYLSFSLFWILHSKLVAHEVTCHPVPRHRIKVFCFWEVLDCLVPKITSVLQGIMGYISWHAWTVLVLKLCKAFLLMIEKIPLENATQPLWAQQKLPCSL